jgi:hypothetical protein
MLVRSLPGQDALRLRAGLLPRSTAHTGERVERAVPHTGARSCAPVGHTRLLCLACACPAARRLLSSWPWCYDAEEH